MMLLSYRHTYINLLKYCNRNMGFFINRDPVPLDPVFSITDRFKKDKSLNKINLGVGAYQTDEGKPWVLPIVKQVEKEIANDDTLNKEYLPISGDADFVKLCLNLFYGKDNDIIKNNYIDGIQTLSGTGGCRLGFDYLRRYQNFKHIYLSNPTWGIHKTLTKFSGFDSFKQYTYFDFKTNLLNFDQMYKDIENAENGSIIVLHGSGHNPTGVDLSFEQWDKLSLLFKQKPIFPFFDCAYIGFCSGDINVDAYPLRKFAQDGHEFISVFSFAKNMGLYNERIGLLSFTNFDGALGIIKDQMKIIVRNTYSNPPSHGARIVKKILNDEKKYIQWIEELNIMTSRIKKMRKNLFNLLVKYKTPGNWNHIIEQKGLFSFTGLNNEQVEELANKYHIYMTTNGRINICGLTSSNIEYVANAIHNVVSK